MKRLLSLWLVFAIDCATCLAGPPAATGPTGGQSRDKSREGWLDRKLLPQTEARSMMRCFLERHLRPLPLPATREAWLARRDALRREVLAVLGIDDLVPPKWDLALKPKGTLRRKTDLKSVGQRGADWQSAPQADLKSVLPPGYRIEKITFESYPGMAIPAVVYVPEGITGRVPGIVSISGHTPASKAADRARDEGPLDRLPGGDPPAPPRRLGRGAGQVQGGARRRVQRADARGPRRRPPVESAEVRGRLFGGRTAVQRLRTAELPELAIDPQESKATS